MDKTTSSEQSMDASGVRSVRRALEILSLLRKEHPVVTLRDVVDDTGLPRTTAIRLIDTLEDCGLVWEVAPNAYAIGPALVRWNGLAAQAWQLPLAVRQAMETLAQQSRETATLFVRQGAHRICIGQAEGPRALRHVTRLGSEHPMWAGAPAKVLLDGVDDDTLKLITAAAPHGPGRLEQLREWRDEVHATGFAVSHGEREDGLSVVAVPVRSSAGEVLAALAVAGPQERFGDTAVEQFVVVLRRAARTVHGQRLLAFADEEALSGAATVARAPRRGTRAIVHVAKGD